MHTCAHTHTHTHTHTHKGVSKLVFYAQSTGTVISGRTQKGAKQQNCILVYDTNLPTGL